MNINLLIVVSIILNLGIIVLLVWTVGLIRAQKSQTTNLTDAAILAAIDEAVDVVLGTGKPTAMPSLNAADQMKEGMRSYISTLRATRHVLTGLDDTDGWLTIPKLIE